MIDSLDTGDPFASPGRYQRMVPRSIRMCSGEPSSACSRRSPSRLMLNAGPTFQRPPSPVGALSVVRERETCIRGQDAAPARHTHAVADLRLETTAGLGIAVRRQATRILNRPQAVHSARRRAPARRNGERNAPTGGPGSHPNGAARPPLLVLAPLVPEQAMGAGLYRHARRRVPDSGPRLQAASSPRIAPVAAQSPSPAKASALPPSRARSSASPPRANAADSPSPGPTSDRARRAPRPLSTPSASRTRPT